MAFCTKVSRFGSFNSVKNAEFSPSQQVLLYAEVDNLHIESSAKGYHWGMKITGQIFDSHGNRVTEYKSTASEDYDQTLRHDFFVSEIYELPRLLPGRYNLFLNIEDTLGRKFGQSSIEFTVRP